MPEAYLECNGHKRPAKDPYCKICFNEFQLYITEKYNIRDINYNRNNKNLPDVI